MREYFLLIILCVCMIGLGWFGNEFYKSYKLDKQLDGLWMHNFNLSEAKEYAYSLDKNGDWVFINIKNMDYPRAYDVCVHECSHQAYSEIFAEQCEKDFNKCRRLMNETN